nr:ABC transporter permease [Lysinibacillus timonensis]
MRGLLFTRFLRISTEWKGTIFWLFSPILLTLLTIKLIGIWGEDTKIPIAIVVEEESELTRQLVNNIINISYLDVQFLDYGIAINELEKHNLDSVFVIATDYEKMIREGERDRLFEAYSSNRSYAYFPVLELITSFVQDDVSRSKAAYEVKDLYEEYEIKEAWNWNEIVQTSIEKQTSQQLLQTSFSYHGTMESIEDEVVPFFNVWAVWSLFSVISTFFLFDWLIKENREEVRIRWQYTKISLKKYAFANLLIYTFVLLILDSITLLIFHHFLDAKISASIYLSLIFFRIVINLIVFLFIQLFKQLFMYYVSSIGLTLLLFVLGGALIPIDGMIEGWHWVQYISPVNRLLHEQIAIEWFCILIVLLCIWTWKGDKVNA